MPRFTWNIVVRGAVIDTVHGTYTEAEQHARRHGFGARVSAPADPSAATSVRRPRRAGAQRAYAGARRLQAV